MILILLICVTCRSNTFRLFQQLAFILVRLIFNVAVFLTPSYYYNSTKSDDMKNNNFRVALLRVKSSFPSSIAICAQENHKKMPPVVLAEPDVDEMHFLRLTLHRTLHYNGIWRRICCSAW